MKISRFPSLPRAALLAMVWLPVELAFAEEPAKEVIATVRSTLPSDGPAIRQFALDGKSDTAYVASGKATAEDHFTVLLDTPVELKSVSVVTGKAGGEGWLDAGVLEVSADGEAFTALAEFASGEAKVDGVGKRVKALRVRPTGDAEQPLAIREIAIESTPAVVTFKYPVEFTVNVDDAPEMKNWADNAAAVCERAYPMLNEELGSEGFKAPTRITMTMSKKYDGVAYASGDKIVGSVKFFTEHPKDVGAMVHETAHVVQQYRGRGNPGWLVEGVADYVRFFKFEPANLGRIDASRARYDRSYRVTAAFLAYLVKTYDKDLVRKLNQAMREGKYREELFQDLTGKTVQDLDAEWRATLK